MQKHPPKKEIGQKQVRKGKKHIFFKGLLKLYTGKCRNINSYFIVKFKKKEKLKKYIDIFTKTINTHLLIK